MWFKRKSKLIIVGIGPFAEIAYEYFTHDSDYSVISFSVEKRLINKNTLFTLPVVPFEELENYYNPTDHKIFIAVGYNNLNRDRARLYLEAKSKKFMIASYTSSKAFVWHNVKIGENCFIFENNVIQPFVKIENNVILWSGNHIGHHSTISDNCFISSHVVVSGFCSINKNCFLGVNSTVANGLKIEKNCLIGAGTNIIKDTLANKVYIGNPAREVRNTNEMEKIR